LRTRSLAIFATNARISPEAAMALFRLATKDARPHLVVRAATGDLGWRTRFVALPAQVHESSPTLSDGLVGEGEAVFKPEMLASRSIALHQEGRLTDAEAAARWSVLLTSNVADQARGKCALARCLITQRRLLEARAALLQVDGEEADRLRAEIVAAGQERPAESSLVDSFLDVLKICQEIERPHTALTRVCSLLRDRMSATTIAFVGRDGDRPHVLSYAGTQPPVPERLEVAHRVLDTSVPVPVAGPSASLRAGGSGAVEAAWPVRYGSDTIAAVWCQWSIGVPVVADDVARLVGLAAAATSPAVHCAVEESRSPASYAGMVPNLIGDSVAMQMIREKVIRAAGSPFPVLIEGESGSGKELVARAIHASSARRDRRICPLNCAALADDLVEAELFGHAKGAFTGALIERGGLFEEAQGGTLFLDEVAELSPRVQAKLLRVLQEGEVRRLGESIVRRIDVRIVSATNRPLDSEVRGGRFRDDLRYRLDVIRIAVPPLRDRLEDIPALVNHLWRSLQLKTESQAALAGASVRLLASYDWPGNVRELQNVLASVIVAGPTKGAIPPGALPPHIARLASLGQITTLAEARSAFEARYVRAALLRADGSLTAAARELGISRQGLSKLMARLDVGI
jgi:DNA-binding NtrC family response regulator